jgi:hypothetical protein
MNAARKITLVRDFSGKASSIFRLRPDPSDKFVCQATTQSKRLNSKLLAAKVAKMKIFSIFHENAKRATTHSLAEDPHLKIFSVVI